MIETLVSFKLRQLLGRKETSLVRSRMIMVSGIMKLTISSLFSCKISIKKRFIVDTTPGNDSMNSFLNIINPCISDADNRHLTNQVTLEEIHHALFSIGHLKAPGPDGLHAIFFQKHWEIVKGSIFNFVHDFFKELLVLEYLKSYKYCLNP